MIFKIHISNCLEEIYNFKISFDTNYGQVTLYSREQIDIKQLNNKKNEIFGSNEDLRVHILKFVWEEVKRGFILIFQLNNSTLILNDFISQSLYIRIVNDVIFINSILEIDEIINIKKNIYEESIRLNHWIINRSPFKNINEYIKVTAGTGIQLIEESNIFKIRVNHFSLLPALYLSNINLNIKKNYLEELMKALIETLKKLKKNDSNINIGIFFSGGIDSTLLLSLTKTLNYKIVIVHNLYIDYLSRVQFIVQSFSLYLKENILFFNSKKIFGIEKFKWMNKSQPFYIGYPETQGGKMPNSIDIQNLGVNVNTIFLHGQNADTLMLFDTHCPSTQLILHERLKGLLLTIKYRILFYILSKFNIKVNSITYNSKFLYYFAFLFIGKDEHEKIHFCNIPIPLKNYSKIERYKYYQHIVLVRKSIANGFNIFNIKEFELSYLELLKWYRFYRTVNNTIDNYGIIESLDRVNRLPIFTSSQILYLLIKYPYSILDIFYPKFIFSKIIKQAVGISYRLFIVKSVLYYFINKIEKKQ